MESSPIFICAAEFMLHFQRVVNLYDPDSDSIYQVVHLYRQQVKDSVFERSRGSRFVEYVRYNNLSNPAAWSVKC